MTWFRASGAMVATYWSVLVTVRIAQTEITEMGISSDASTISTQAVIPLVRRARGFFFDRFLCGPRGDRCVRDRAVRGLLGVHLCSFGLSHPPMPSANWP